MNKKIITLKNEKTITVVDNLLPRSSVEGLYAAACISNYGLMGSSNLDIQDMQNRKMICNVGEEFLVKNNFFTPEVNSFLLEELKTTPFIFKAYINLGIHSECPKIHTDHFASGSGKTILYYVNYNWNQNWAGETFFYNDDCSEVEFISPFVPGRMLIFDSSIPHSAKQQTFDAPPYRFTLALKFVDRLPG